MIQLAGMADWGHVGRPQIGLRDVADRSHVASFIDLGCPATRRSSCCPTDVPTLDLHRRLRPALSLPSLPCPGPNSHSPGYSLGSLSAVVGAPQIISTANSLGPL
jgi:hypothetical protein